MRRLSPRPAFPGNPGGDRRWPEAARVSERALEASCPHYAGQVDEGEDDVFVERNSAR
jgi:hypothetical protein